MQAVCEPTQQRHILMRRVYLLDATSQFVTWFARSLHTSATAVAKHCWSSVISDMNKLWTDSNMVGLGHSVYCSETEWPLCCKLSKFDTGYLAWHCPSACTSCLDQDKVWTDCIAKEHAWTNSNTEFELDPSRSSLWDRLSPLGHIVWARDTLSNFQTSCLILRQAVSSWDKLSEFETGRLATVWVVYFQDKLFRLWTDCTASQACDRIAGCLWFYTRNRKRYAMRRGIFQELYAEKNSIYNLWLQLCTQPHNLWHRMWGPGVATS